MCHPSQTPILQGSCTIADKKCTSNYSRKPVKAANHSPYVISNAHKVNEYITSTSNLQNIGTAPGGANNTYAASQSKATQINKTDHTGDTTLKSVHKDSQTQRATHQGTKLNSGPNTSERTADPMQSLASSYH